jgi:hypothetical protein
MRDGTLKHLAECTSLERIDAYGTKVTDAGLAHLTKLPNLRMLRVSDTQVTEAGAKRLQQFLPNCEIEYDEE